MDTDMRPLVRTEISLRDYFASCALIGYLAADHSGPEYIAKCAYEYADAMIIAKKEYDRYQISQHKI
jgi:hypothetical protein